VGPIISELYGVSLHDNLTSGFGVKVFDIADFLFNKLCRFSQFFFTFHFLGVVILVLDRA
jgi:hypothetical protein